MSQEPDKFDNEFVEAIKKNPTNIEEVQQVVFCDVCGEEIENEVLVKEGKMYCSEECMERESGSTLEKHSRKVSLC